MSLILFLLDKSKNTKESRKIIKPNSYQELLDFLNKNFKNIPEFYEIYYSDKGNKEIIINNEETYKQIGDIIFIKESEINLLGESNYEKNYNKLSESKQDILDVKYNCILCTTTVKNENPFFCYKCQKIFHAKCMNDWDIKCKAENKKLSCPHCRNELPIENWNKKLDFEEDRKFIAELLDIINDLKNKIIKNELIEKYQNYIFNTLKIFEKILQDLNSINSLLHLKKNIKLNSIMNTFPLNFENLNICDISGVIKEEFNKFKKDITEKNTNYMNLNDKKVNLHDININYKIDFKNQLSNKKNNLIYVANNNLNKKVNNFQLEDFKNKYELIYYVQSEGNYNIFGEDFVSNNRNNLDLIINGKHNILVSYYKLKEGENLISLVIRNKLNNLSYMFYKCDSLKEIGGLKDLDVRDVKDFSFMFSGCSQLSNIKPLQNWSVTNVKNFQGMFSGCSSLSDLSPLEYWDTSNVNNFQSMFLGCSSLSDIRSLKNWNVLGGNDFSYMFSYCSQLSNIKPLLNWNISNGTVFKGMFHGCSTLLNKNDLQNWKYLNNNAFLNIFEGNPKLSNDESLNNKINAFDFNVNERISLPNGLIIGIINNYEEIDNVIKKIESILFTKVIFNLEYRASDFGDQAETFHTMCDKLNMSLVLIETTNHTRFGGFTTKSWAGINIIKRDNNAFVFSLDTNKMFDVIPNERAVGCYPKFGPVFMGCQIRIYDNFFNKGGTTCRKHLNYETKIDYELNNGEQFYYVKDIEVYGIIPVVS